MKIAVYHNLPSGGAKRSLYELISRTKSKHEYTLYRPAIEANEEYMDLRDLVHHEYSQGFDGLSALSLAGKSIFAQRKFLKKFQQLEVEIAEQINRSDADAVFVMSCMFTHSPGLISKLNKPCVYFLQEPRRQSFEYNLSPLIQRVAGIQKSSDVPGYLARYTLQLSAISDDIRAVRAATKILCNSYFSHESILRSYGVDAEVCYLGVDSQSTPKAIPSKSASASVLIVGALHPNKNQLLMIEAIGLLPKKERPAIECVYDRGEGAYERLLQDRARELDVELILSRRISDEELTQKYRAAKAVACLAELEPFGFTPLEANLMGTPVIALKEGGYRETVIHGETGLFVNRDAESVVSALKKIDQHAWNRAKLRRHAEQWNWARTVKQYETALGEVARG